VAIVLALVSTLALTAVGVSWFAFVYAKSLVQAANRRTDELQHEMDRTVQATKAGLEELSADVQDMGRQPSVTAAPARLRGGLNLTTRSQVLRLHRRGESAEQIASILEIPKQEVDLLLKVHRIVLSTMEIADRPVGLKGRARPEPETLG
jgi:type II secretory pathway component PulM